MTAHRAEDLHFMQSALNTSDMAATLQLYSEALGFDNAALMSGLRQSLPLYLGTFEP
jgi:hypothetical protein